MPTTTPSTRPAASANGRYSRATRVRPPGSCTWSSIISVRPVVKTIAVSFSASSRDGVSRPTASPVNAVPKSLSIALPLRSIFAVPSDSAGRRTTTITSSKSARRPVAAWRHLHGREPDPIKPAQHRVSVRHQSRIHHWDSPCQIQPDFLVICISV